MSAEEWYGQHAYEDLMSRAEPQHGLGQSWYYLSDLAAEFHIDEHELALFAWKHLPDDDFIAEAMTVTENGADLLRTFLSKGN